MAQLVKNLPAMWEDLGSIPGLGRSPGEGKTIEIYRKEEDDQEKSHSLIILLINVSW